MITNEIYPTAILERPEKEILLQQKACVIWLMGLSGAGKSTLSHHLAQKLHEDGFLTQSLDGDNLRTGLNNNLGFSDVDRLENIRRAAEVAKLFLNCGIIVIASFICPTHTTQNMVRNIVGTDFVEIFVNCPLDVCEARDVKGLYAKARAGVIKDFTGIDSPFESPQSPELIVNTHQNSLEECIQQIYQLVLPKIKVS
ncbi:MAG: adenylyl-sulfate kinase [Raineya sp.]|jgi:adenylylsulfate kinase|nr:adenylyl-sulfate kinase [Raineya sp.]